MKVFWSWQSDHHGSISRHLIRKSLERSINELNASPEIVDADRPATLDHDTKGVTGSPDLVRTTFEKIDASDVLVADVTPVGTALPQNGRGRSKKKLINANVAIEVGYGLAKITDARLIMVLNSHFGNHDDLPFDLRHKGGAIVYQLAPNAPKEQIARVEKELTGKFRAALRGIHSQLKPLQHDFTPQPAQSSDPARYFKEDEILVSRQSTFRGGQADFIVPKTPLLYLRLQPTHQMPLLGRAEALEFVRKGPAPLEPFYYEQTSISFEANTYGAIAYEATSDSAEIIAAAQLFLNREIWAFTSILLDPELSTRRKHGNKLIVPTQSVERTFLNRISGYLKFMVEKLDVPFPVAIEAGASDIKGYYLGMPSNFFDYLWGPVHDRHVVWKGKIGTSNEEEINEVLHCIFQAFFDAAAKERPTGLYGFPPA